MGQNLIACCLPHDQDIYRARNECCLATPPGGSHPPGGAGITWRALARSRRHTSHAGLSWRAKRRAANRVYERLRHSSPAGQGVLLSALTARHIWLAASATYYLDGY